jgi:hypothetical protein
MRFGGLIWGGLRGARLSVALEVRSEVALEVRIKNAWRFFSVEPGAKPCARLSVAPKVRIKDVWRFCRVSGALFGAVSLPGSA